MSETTTYTPGPWIAGIDSLVMAGEKKVATADVGCGCCAGCPDEEDLANARLISAAPEMAEVLVRMLAKYRVQNPTECDDHDCLCVSVVKQAEDALQKAGLL